MKKFIDVYGWKLIIVASAIATVLICLPNRFFFLNDDFIYISKSPALNFVYRTAFRPVSDLTLLLDYTLSGKNAFGYHLTNLVIHLICTALVFVLSMRMQSLTNSNECRKFFPVVASVLFMVYAFHSESVFWIIGRGGSLVTLFILLSLSILLKSKPNNASQIAALLVYVPALLVYESAWLFPLLVLSIWWVRKKNGNGVSMQVAIIGSWLLFAIHLLSRKIMLNDFIASPYLDTDHFEFVPSKIMYNYATGIFRSLLPPFESSMVFVCMSGVVAILIIVFVWNSIKKKCAHSYEFMLFCWWLIALLPVAILGVNTHNTESERFLYLPTAFLCPLLVLQLSKIRHSLFRNSATALLLMLHLYLFNQSSGVYATAGRVDRQLLEAFNGFEGEYNKLIVVNLPQQYKGGFMFRLGFEEALHWFQPGLRFKQLEVSSKLTYNTKPQLKVVSEPPYFTSYFIDSLSPASLVMVADGERIFVGKYGK